MKQIAKKFGLADWKMVKQSHSEHIIKDLGMDRALRPLVKAEPKLFRDRVGLVLDNTHKEYPAPKGEFNLEYKQADVRIDLKPKEVVTAMELITDNKKALENLLDNPITKSDFVQFKDEIRQELREFATLFVAELKDAIVGKKPEPTKPYDNEGGMYR
jgi:hypothetical protein